METIDIEDREPELQFDERTGLIHVNRNDDHEPFDINLCLGLCCLCVFIPCIVAFVIISVNGVCGVCMEILKYASLLFIGAFGLFVIGAITLSVIEWCKNRRRDPYDY